MKQAVRVHSEACLTVRFQDFSHHAVQGRDKQRRIRQRCAKLGRPVQLPTPKRKRRNSHLLTSTRFLPARQGRESDRALVEATRLVDMKDLVKDPLRREGVS